jgi:uncharacterized membrane protein (DUF485 family)
VIVTFENMQRRQLRLSLALAAVFLVSVFTIPVLNQLAPDMMLTPVLGIPFVWLYVGVGLHLEFWGIAILYTVFSNRWERNLRHDGGDAGV